jgi:hypothetical protein
LLGTELIINLSFNVPIVDSNLRGIATSVFLGGIRVKASKAIPLQAWTGPEGSRRLKLPDFKTFGT